MENKEGVVVAAELGIPGAITVTENPGRISGSYTLIAIVQEAVHEKVFDDWVPEGNGRNKHVVEYADVVKTKYVFRMNKDSEIAKAESEREAALIQKSGAEEKARNAFIKMEIAEKKEKEQKKLVDRLKTRLDRVEGELRTAKSLNIVMERDLALVRQALGDIKMNEIVTKK